MIDGNLGYPWPADLHEWHSQRRWNEAKHAYRKDHPELAEQEMADLVGEYRARHWTADTSRDEDSGGW